MSVNTKKRFISNIDYSHILSDYGIWIGFVIIFVFLSIFAGNFLTYGNLMTVLRQVSMIGIATIGVGILIIMNCIDLSIGSLFALSGVISALVVSVGANGFGLPTPLAFAAGICASMIISTFNGFVIAKARIPAFIVTMGMMSIARGLALIAAHGMPIGSLPDSFTYIGTATIDPWRFVPWTVVIYAIVIVTMHFIMNKRPLGRYIYAVGSNEDAAKTAGINIVKVKVQAYILEGFLVGLAATVLTARLKSASPSLGVGYELDAIAGSIIGGVSFSGGIGTIPGMVLGALYIGIINNGMDLLGVDAFYKQIVKGSIIIIAVLIDRKRSGRA